MRRGFTTKRMKTPNTWDHTRILAILKNETYAGVRQFGRRGKMENIPQDVPALVPRATWDAAQTLIGTNQKFAQRRAKRNYLLRGIITCALDGRRYVGYTTNSGSNSYYKCNRHQCPSPNVRADLLEEFVWRDIAGFAKDPGDVLETLQGKIGESIDDAVERELAEVEAALTHFGTSVKPSSSNSASSASRRKRASNNS